MAAPRLQTVAKAAKPFVSPQRRSLIGKVHVAKKELSLSDTAYRDRMFRVTGQSSAADCTDAQLTALLANFRDELGWQAKPRNPASKRTGRADSPTARKARALWISLHQLGAVEDGRESALEAFAKRQLKVERLAWARADQMDSVIEALVGIAKRHGWNAKDKSLPLIKANLLDALLAKLKAKEFAAESWSLAEAAERIAGFIHPRGMPANHWDFGDVDAVTAAFARLLKTGRKDLL